MAKEFELPDSPEFFRRVQAFNPSGREFHNYLIRMAGQKMEAVGFVVAYGLAVADYTSEKNLSQVMVTVLEIAEHTYAKKLIDDPDAQSEVLTVLAQLGLPHN